MTNLLALAQEDAGLWARYQPYGTVRRYLKTRDTTVNDFPGETRPYRQASAAWRSSRCSYEAEYTHGLWHADFHHGFAVY